VTPAEQVNDVQVHRHATVPVNLAIRVVRPDDRVTPDKGTRDDRGQLRGTVRDEQGTRGVTWPGNEPRAGRDRAKTEMIGADREPSLPCLLATFRAGSRTKSPGRHRKIGEMQ
jgi:hypothetical protein